MGVSRRPISSKSRNHVSHSRRSTKLCDTSSATGENSSSARHPESGALEGHPAAALRSHRQTWLHCSRRAGNLDDQVCALVLAAHFLSGRKAFLRELTANVECYNQARPHTGLGGRTPNEVYIGTFPANRRPRPSSRGHGGRMARRVAELRALARGSPGAELTLGVSFHRRGTASAHRQAEASCVDAVRRLLRGNRTVGAPTGTDIRKMEPIFQRTLRCSISTSNGTRSF